MGLASSAVAGTFSRMIVFGDSLSDVGNVHNATFGITPASPPHFGGRFTNGPVWAERLAQRLELPGLAPSRTGGLNYAHGGVTSASGNTFFFPFFSFPNAGSQVNAFLASNSPRTDDLFVLWAGGNDFLDGQTNVDVVVNNIAARVTTLSNAGAQHILLANLPRLGEIPRFNTSATNRATYNNRIVAYNSALASRINSLDASLNASLWYLDVGAQFDVMLSSPASFGFSNVTNQALVNGVVNPNVGQFLFWDDVHPTGPAHAILGAAAFEVMTERRSVASATALPWTSGSTWSKGVTPDRLSNVVLEGAVVIETDQVVRRFDLNARSLTFVLALESPELTAGESVDLAGTILLARGPAYVPLPGSLYNLFSTGSISGSPTLENATGLAGLWWEPIVSATSLAVRAAATPGDADLDATVGFADLLSLAQSYGQTGLTWLAGDFTGDGSTNFDDLLLLAQNYTSGSLHADWTLARSIVPEPASLGMILAGVLLLRRR
jgi:phospholipase/lecithinase/hemolysin